jgi:hypothetical protein
LTWTTRLGGKAGLAPAAWLTLQAGQTSESEPLPPLANDLAGRVEAGGDDVVGKSIGRHENDSGADDVTIR